MRDEYPTVIKILLDEINKMEDEEIIPKDFFIVRRGQEPIFVEKSQQ